jgi:hypothetical protein
MRWALVGVIVLHGLIHLMGFAKAYGYAELPQLTRPISRPLGALWLLAGGLVAAAATMLALGSPAFWKIGALAALTSQVVIATAWQDARAGSLANLVLLLVATHGFLTEGPSSFHARYLAEVAASRSRSASAPLVTEEDVAPLPEPVQRYLRLTRAVGQPRVRNYHVRFAGRIRSGPGAMWMPFEAEQDSFADEPARLFLMRARMLGAPVEAFHRLVDGRATMQVKLAGVVTIADARGPEMDRSETVTLFNDMCLLAPGTLVGPGISWEPLDPSTVRARFTQHGTTITATLFFAGDGRLVNFESDDRSRALPDGTFTRTPFSTPVRDYRSFGPSWLAGAGDARWRLPAGDFTYAEFTMRDIATSVP